MTEKNLPGDGLFGWLGRQIGYVTKAIKTDPTVVAKRETVEDQRDPAHPNLVFRRTVTDEVRLDVGALQEAQQKGPPKSAGPNEVEGKPSPSSSDRE